jgi:Leucine-rich repeat (LRR) protein
MKKSGCLLLLLLSISFYSFAQREQDSLALVAFYNSTNGANWANNTNWLSSNPINTWFGVTLYNNRVINLKLRSNLLSGSIPSQIGNLTNLQSLVLNFNPQLSGSIPSQIGNLTNLQNLDLSYNQLTGSIPSQIGNLINLDYLY